MKKINLSLLTLFLISPNAKVKANNNTNLILGSTITGLAIWLIGEKTHKHYINKELNKYKQKKYEIEESENLINNSEKHLNYLNQNFNVINNYNNNYLIRFNRETSSTENINILTDRYNQNNKFIDSLKIKSLSWKQKNKSEFLKKAQDLLADLEKWTPTLKNSLTYYKTLKNIHDLKELSKNIKSTYKQEISALTSLNKYKLIDLIILEKFNTTDHYFPRISFVNNIEEDIKNLKLLTNSSYKDYKENYNNFMTNTELQVINNQNNLILNLEEIKNIASTSTNYILEKKEKPKFDREQQLLNVKIKEREAKIYAEKEKNRILLEREKNQAKTIENQRKEQNIRDNTIKLELERIQNGQVLRENNTKWQKKIDSINTTYQRNNNLLKDIKNQLTEIATKDLGDNPPYNPQSKQYISYLKEKVKRLLNKLNYL